MNKPSHNITLKNVPQFKYSTNVWFLSTVTNGYQIKQKWAHVKFVFVDIFIQRTSSRLSILMKSVSKSSLSPSPSLVSYTGWSVQFLRQKFVMNTMHRSVLSRKSFI